MEVFFAVSLCGLACREEMDKWAFFLLPTPHPLALLQLVMLLSYEAIEVPSPQCSRHLTPQWRRELSLCGLAFELNIALLLLPSAFQNT